MGRHDSTTMSEKQRWRAADRTCQFEASSPRSVLDIIQRWQAQCLCLAKFPQRRLDKRSQHLSSQHCRRYSERDNPTTKIRHTRHDKMQFSQIFLLASVVLTASCAAIPRRDNAATLQIRDDASTNAASGDLSADADEATAYSLTGGWKRDEASTNAADSNLSADADEATAYSLTGGW